MKRQSKMTQRLCATIAVAFLYGSTFNMMLVSSGVAFAAGGGGGGGATVCSPISSLTAKGDPTVGDSGLSSVQMGWSVKPCSNTQTVRVVAQLINWNTKEVVYLDLNAALNGKIVVFVSARQIYDGTVTVLDAVTGEVLATRTVGASTIAKGV